MSASEATVARGRAEAATWWIGASIGSQSGRDFRSLAPRPRTQAHATVGEFDVEEAVAGVGGNLRSSVDHGAGVGGRKDLDLQIACAGERQTNREERWQQPSLPALVQVRLDVVDQHHQLA
jgi:hypothetical protein